MREAEVCRGPGDANCGAALAAACPGTGSLAFTTSKSATFRPCSARQSDSAQLHPGLLVADSVLTAPPPPKLRSSPKQCRPSVVGACPELDSDLEQQLHRQSQIRSQRQTHFHFRQTPRRQSHPLIPLLAGLAWLQGQLCAPPISASRPMSFFPISVCGTAAWGVMGARSNARTAAEPCVWFEATISCCWLRCEYSTIPIDATARIPAAKAPQRSAGHVSQPIRVALATGMATVSVAGKASATTSLQSPQSARCSIKRARSFPERDCSANAVSKLRRDANRLLTAFLQPLQHEFWNVLHFSF